MAARGVARGLVGDGEPPDATMPEGGGSPPFCKGEFLPRAVAAA